MQRLLGEVRGEGALESEGRFTLDAARALELMSRYALPEPQRYILNLVSWAAASGATACELTTGGGKLDFRHDGEAPTCDQLRDLYADFGRGSVALQELAIGLFAAAGMRPKELILEGEGARLVDGKLERSDTSGARFVLRERGLFPAYRTELALCAEHVHFPLRCNGKVSTPELELPTLARAIWLRGEGSLGLTNLPPKLSERPGPFEALVGVADVPLLSAPVQAIVRGLRFDLPGLPGAFAAACLPHALKDLSQARLVDDPAVTRVLQATLQELL